MLASKWKRSDGTRRAMISEDELGTACLRSIDANAEENATDEKMRAKVRRIVRLMVAG